MKKMDRLPLNPVPNSPPGKLSGLSSLTLPPLRTVQHARETAEGTGTSVKSTVIHIQPQTTVDVALAQVPAGSTLVDFGPKPAENLQPAVQSAPAKTPTPKMTAGDLLAPWSGCGIVPADTTPAPESDREVGDDQARHDAYPSDEWKSSPPQGDAEAYTAKYQFLSPKDQPRFLE